MRSPLRLAASPPLPLWEELADEARNYIDLLERLKDVSSESPDRDELERGLMDSLAHLQVHSLVLEEGVTDAIELSDDLAESTS